jgi:hypothetical protein
MHGKENALSGMDRLAIALAARISASGDGMHWFVARWVLGVTAIGTALIVASNALKQRNRPHIQYAKDAALHNKSMRGKELKDLTPEERARKEELDQRFQELYRQPQS